ncbi:hypothetical protein QUA86_19585 [Microcoleus sp. F6_B6]
MKEEGSSATSNVQDVTDVRRKEGRKKLTVNCQLSTVNCQLLTVNC